MFLNQLFIVNIIIGSDSVKLIVGLGNPGKDYVNTRHNVGFDFIDTFLDNKKINPVWSKKFDGLYFQTEINGDKVIFLKPMTFMNLSGESVYKIINYFHINVDDILVICDDMDLNVGNFKLKATGSSGGHNGLKNISDHLHSNDFKRLKIGISRSESKDYKDFVLGHFSKEDRKILESLFISLIPVLDDYFTLSFGDLMSKYNRKNR